MQWPNTMESNSLHTIVTMMNVLVTVHTLLLDGDNYGRECLGTLLTGILYFDTFVESRLHWHLGRGSNFRYYHELEMKICPKRCHNAIAPVQENLESLRVQGGEICVHHGYNTLLYVI